MGFVGSRWSDFHAKRMGSENAWETALRGCKEAVGVDLSHALLTRAPIFHPESTSQSVIFWVKTDLQPVDGCHPNMLEYRQFTAWPEPLHDRLKYDKGFALKREMDDLGFLLLEDEAN